MKKIQILLMLLMVGIPAMEAQNYKMVLKKTDGTTHEFPVEEILEISMEEIVPDLPLRVIVSENEMIDPSASAKSKRIKARAPITTTSTLTSFAMHGNNYDYYLTKESSQWKANRDYWPRDVSVDTDVKFYAHSAGDYYSDSNGQYIQFSVVDNPANQHDLLVATKTTSYNASNGAVNLTFDHACTAVEFNVCMTSKLKTELGDHRLTVKRIELKDVYNSGEYYFDDDSWRNLTTKYDANHNAIYTLTNSDINVSTELTHLPCEYLFMIPQTTEGSARLEVNYTIDSSESKTATIPLSNISWDAGFKYTMNIKLNTSMIEL